MKWCLMSMCLVLECYTGLLVSFTMLLLSHSSGTSLNLIPKSFNVAFIHSNCGHKLYHGLSMKIVAKSNCCHNQLYNSCNKLSLLPRFNLHCREFYWHCNTMMMLQRFYSMVAISYHYCHDLICVAKSFIRIAILK